MWSKAIKAATVLAATSTLGLTAPATASAATTAASHAAAHHHHHPAAQPPPGFIWYAGHTYDNWVACSVVGTAGVLTFQWEGYQCLQNDNGRWDLWVHPW